MQQTKQEAEDKNRDKQNLTQLKQKGRFKEILEKKSYRSKEKLEKKSKQWPKRRGRNFNWK